MIPLQGIGRRRVGDAKVWSGRGPRKGFLADTRRSHGRWVHGELQMPEDRTDHLSVRMIRWLIFWTTAAMSASVRSSPLTKRGRSPWAVRPT